MKKIGLLFLSLLFFSNSYSQNPCPNLATVVYEGKTYNTVAIGNQCWLKENLDVGTQVIGTVDQTNNGTIEKYCYNNDPTYCTTYGGLYQWNEAMQYVTTPGTQGICPIGWHLPTQTELQTLEAVVGNNSNALKAVGQGTGVGSGTNASGFSALLAGYRYYGPPPSFSYFGTYTYFWSSTVDAGITNSYSMVLNKSDVIISVSSHTKTLGASVRCLNDLSVSTLLPVELNLFTGVADGRTIQLKWSTQTEKNSDKFFIERQTIGAAWEAIGSVRAAVVSNSLKNY